METLIQRRKERGNYKGQCCCYNYPKLKQCTEPATTGYFCNSHQHVAKKFSPELEKAAA